MPHDVGTESEVIPRAENGDFDMLDGEYLPSCDLSGCSGRSIPGRYVEVDTFMVDAIVKVRVQPCDLHYDRFLMGTPHQSDR